MGDTSAAKIQVTAQCAYLNLQEGKACEAILKETRELWQKSGNIQCEKDLKQVAQELTLTCQGRAAAKVKPKESKTTLRTPKVRSDVDPDGVLVPPKSKHVDPDGVNAPSL